MSFSGSVADLRVMLRECGGEMGKRIDEFNWATTCVGPIESWNRALLNAVFTLITFECPVVLFIGEDFVQLYNDRAIPILAKRHPHHLGQPVIVAWGEVWDYVQPKFEVVMTTNATVYEKNTLFLFTRKGYLEETYLTFSYSPILSEEQRVSAGIVTLVVETTHTVLREARIATLDAIKAKTAKARDTDEVMFGLATSLALQPSVVPLALIYLSDIVENIPTEESGLDILASRHQYSCQMRLRCVSGVPGLPLNSLADFHGSLTTCNARHPPGIMTLIEPLAYDDAARVVQADPFLSIFEFFNGASQKFQTVHQVMLIPFPEPLRGVLIVGINSRRELDQLSLDFLDQLANDTIRIIHTIREEEAIALRKQLDSNLLYSKSVLLSHTPRRFTLTSLDFRSPLARVIHNLEVSRKDQQLPVSHLQRERQMIAHRKSLRVLKRANTLFAYSYAQCLIAEAVFESTDLSRFTADLARTFQPSIIRAGLDFIVDTHPINQSVYVDRQMYEHIVFNLLSNAFKFCLSGEIRISLRPSESGDSVDLVVRDTGIGIPKGELSLLFAPKRNRRVYENGIGLILVHELVRAHKARISVSSELNVGTEFTITFLLGKGHIPMSRVGVREAYRISLQAAFIAYDSAPTQTQQPKSYGLANQTASGADPSNSADHSDSIDKRRSSVVMPLRLLTSSSSSASASSPSPFSAAEFGGFDYSETSSTESQMETRSLLAEHLGSSSVSLGHLSMSLSSVSSSTPTTPSSPVMQPSVSSCSRPPEITPSISSEFQKRIALSYILIVDPDPDMQTYLHSVLTPVAPVQCVARAEDAMRETLANPPSLILSELEMDNMDGMQLVAALRSCPSTKSVPFILLSVREAARTQGLAAGADDFVLKPFASKELVARAHCLIEIGRMRRVTSVTTVQS